MKENPELTPGTVTRIARQKKDPQRVSVYIDGMFAFGVHQDVLLEHELRKGAQLSVEAQRDLVLADERIRARTRAFDLIAYRSRSSHELTQRLRRDGFEESAIEAALARVRELGYIDDRAFAREFASSRLASKGFGPHRIARELRARGIDGRIVDDVIAELFADDDTELNEAQAFARKRMPRLERETETMKKRKKLYDALMRRGYSADVVRRVLDEYVQTSR